MLVFHTIESAMTTQIFELVLHKIESKFDWIRDHRKAIGGFCGISDSENIFEMCSSFEMMYGNSSRFIIKEYICVLTLRPSF